VPLHSPKERPAASLASASPLQTSLLQALKAAPSPFTGGLFVRCAELSGLEPLAVGAGSLQVHLPSEGSFFVAKTSIQYLDLRFKTDAR
jgi:hypothetical protein